MRAAIILDMDETLLHTPDKAMLASRIQSIPRPGVGRTLNLLEKFGDLYVLSAGTPDYIPEALRSIRQGARFAGKHFSSRESHNLRDRLRLNRRRWVLLDDTPWGHARTNRKMRMCGSTNAAHFVWVAPFEGGKNDSALSGAIPLILASLALQGAPGARQGRSR
jgi:hypothetical protein